MKQYKISFYYVKPRSEAKPTVYYREFETFAELVNWAKDILDKCPWFARYTYIKASLPEFLENTNY